MSKINQLSFEQLHILESIKNGKNVFITGHAGTGKSFLLNCIKDIYYSRGLHVTASTGIAALQCGGITIHSWAGLGTGQADIDFLIQNIMSAKGKFLRKRIKSCKVLAIDEISMLSGEVFVKLDYILRAVKDNNKPFGGTQLILIGDFCQLPPVTRDNIEPIFCFETISWQEANIQTFYLKQVFRQNQDDFINLLSNIRNGTITKQDITLLNSRILPLPEVHNLTYLATHNAIVDKINIEYLNRLQTKAHVFKMIGNGDEYKVGYLKQNCIAPQQLELKIGAQVMMLKNTYAKDGIINGSIGRIIDFITEDGDFLPMVKFDNGVVKVIGYDSWDYEELDLITLKPKIIASVMQIPLNLAWAVTIHKSQGMTLDGVYCDLKNSFAGGQIYVALSRVRTLEGLYLKNFNVNSITPNQKVLKFEQNNFSWQEKFFELI